MTPHSPKYQKFKIDKLPKIIHYETWDYKDYIPYLEWKYGKRVKPVNRRSDCDISDNCTCPRCNAPNLFFIRIMVPRDKSAARSAPPRSPDETVF